MNSAAVFSLLTLLLLSFALPTSTAVNEGASANGSYEVSVDNSTSREITFNASSAGDGSTTGEITFRDLAKESVQPPRESPDKDLAEDKQETAKPKFFAKVLCDCLKVEGVEAILSGTVTESSREAYVGQRVVLVVQDGDSLTPPLRDKLTWGFYKSSAKNWVATDAERPDAAPAPAWVATDAERPEDSGKINQKSDQINCESFPITSYSFVDAKNGHGKIEVRR